MLYGNIRKRTPGRSRLPLAKRNSGRKKGIESAVADIACLGRPIWSIKKSRGLPLQKVDR